MPLTDDQVEFFAIRAAKGNNGGEWATHYTETHKEFWRNFVRGMVEEIAAHYTKNHKDSLDGIALEIADELVRNREPSA
jgi:hypothetical protein